MKSVAILSLLLVMLLTLTSYARAKQLSWSAEPMSKNKMLEDKFFDYILEIFQKTLVSPSFSKGCIGELHSILKNNRSKFWKCKFSLFLISVTVKKVFPRSLIVPS